MAKYKYKFGLFHGRFQHVHVGHQKIVDKMLSECRKQFYLLVNASHMVAKEILLIF